jgi:glucose 1-dehydrogenase
VPLQPDSAAVVDIEEPTPEPGELLVDGLALGVCGTDREIAAGDASGPRAARARP